VHAKEIPVLQAANLTKCYSNLEVHNNYCATKMVAMQSKCFLRHNLLFTDETLLEISLVCPTDQYTLTQQSVNI